MRRLLIGLVLALVTVLSAAGTSQAHTDLVSVTPGRGEVVHGAPQRVELEFSTAVLDRLAQVVVRDEAGNDHVTGRPAAFYTRVVARVAALDPGRYTVAYRVVAADGHPISGRYAFTVAAAEQGTAATTDATEQTGATGATAPSVEPASAGQDPAGVAGTGAAWLVPALAAASILLVVGLRVLHGLRRRAS